MLDRLKLSIWTFYRFFGLLLVVKLYTTYFLYKVFYMTISVWGDFISFYSGIYFYEFINTKKIKYIELIK